MSLFCIFKKDSLLFCFIFLILFNFCITSLILYDWDQNHNNLIFFDNIDFSNWEIFKSLEKVILFLLSTNEIFSLSNNENLYPASLIKFLACFNSSIVGKSVVNKIAISSSFFRLIYFFLNKLKEDDLVIFTADHGNDPTYVGTDHTRENVPVIFFSKSFKYRGTLETRDTFACIGATILDNFGIENTLGLGTSYLDELK